MLERGVGAFLVALVGLGFLVGPSLEGHQLLVITAIAAVIALVAAYLLRPKRGERAAGMDALVFDSDATRRAVRRGIVRTGLTAVVWLFFGSILLSILTHTWQTIGSRDDRFRPILGNAFLVAHPGYRGDLSQRHPNPKVEFRSLQLQVRLTPRSAHQNATTRDVWLKLDLFGNLDRSDLFQPPTPIADALRAERPDPLATRRLLTRLPEAVTVSAAVELRTATTMRSFQRLLARQGFLDPGGSLPEELPIILQQLHVLPYDYPSRHVAGPLVWPKSSMAEFQAWAKRLRDEDDQTLSYLYLPPVSAIKAVARQARVYGFIADRVPKSRLRRLLDDPAIRSIRVADVAFDLDQNPVP